MKVDITTNTDALTQSTAAAMLLRGMNAGRAKDAREVLCAAEGGDLAQVARMVATMDRDTLALALWVCACKSMESNR